MGAFGLGISLLLTGAWFDYGAFISGDPDMANCN
jgi:hypothetical protein